MSQMPVGQAKSLLEKAGYSVRMSRKHQGRLIVARGKLSASLAVLMVPLKKGSGDCSNWRSISTGKWSPIDRSDLKEKGSGPDRVATRCHCHFPGRDPSLVRERQQKKDRNTR